MEKLNRVDHCQKDEKSYWSWAWSDEPPSKCQRIRDLKGWESWRLWVLKCWVEGYKHASTNKTRRGFSPPYGFGITPVINHLTGIRLLFAFNVVCAMSALNEWDLIASGTSSGFMVTVAIWDQCCSQHVMGFEVDHKCGWSFLFPCSFLNWDSWIKLCFQEAEISQLAHAFWLQPHHVKFSPQHKRNNLPAKQVRILWIVWSMWLKHTVKVVLVVLFVPR